jgi:hypothetical protein
VKANSGGEDGPLKRGWATWARHSIVAFVTRRRPTSPKVCLAERPGGPSCPNPRDSAVGAAPTPGTPGDEEAGEVENETELSLSEAVAIATALIAGLGLLAALTMWWF